MAMTPGIAVVKFLALSGDLSLEEKKVAMQLAKDCPAEAARIMTFMEANS